jgi:hypothetical protein
MRGDRERGVPEESCVFVDLSDRTDGRTIRSTQQGRGSSGHREQKDKRDNRG